MKMKTKQNGLVLLKKDDLILAWSLMENITVSLDQIWGTYAHGMDENSKWVDEEAYSLRITVQGCPFYFNLPKSK